MNTEKDVKRCTLHIAKKREDLSAYVRVTLWRQKANLATDLHM